MAILEPSDLLAGLPETPGVYVFRDARGRPIYIGKAKNLKRRVGSYFHRAPSDAKTGRMLQAAVAFDTIVTDTEVEALSVESSLIKKHHPRFNVFLRDDKSFPYIKITTGEAWPRALVTRRVLDDGHTYFGPFIPGGHARRKMQMLTRYLRIRTCSITIDGRLPRPCLYYDLHACPGPCVEGLTTAAEYAEAVEEALLFLRGRHGELAPRLSAHMESAAGAEQFELAAHYRDLLRSLEAEAELKTESLRGENVDLFGVAFEGREAALVVLLVRGGRVADQRRMFWSDPDAASAGELIAAVLPQLYAGGDAYPDEIHVAHDVSECELLETWLKARAGRAIPIRRPERGEKRQRLEMAEENARTALRLRLGTSAAEREASARLARLFELPRAAERIVGFDISHFQGGQTYASAVVFERGRPKKSAYRLYAIRTVTNDDFTALAEAVERAFDAPRPDGLPDLVLIDGGRGQVEAARGALEKLGLELPILSLAKREEEVYRPNVAVPQRLSRSDPALQLLQRVRDEAHRFALRAHRRRRGKAAVESRLSAVPGIGPKRLRRLLTKFASLEAIAAATEAELAEAVGETAARAVRAALSAD